MKGRHLVLAAALMLLAASGLLGPRFSGAGQTLGGNGVWQLIDESSIVVRGRRLIVPNAYQAVRLNQTALAQVLSQAPLEFTAAARTAQVVLTVPMPDGSFSRFRVEESPIMGPGLAAKVPHIKTYRGQGIDDPTATARFDRTPAGFHAIAFTRGGTVLIDPYAEGDTTNYITYFKRDVTKTSRFECHFSEFDPDLVSLPAAAPAPQSAAAGEVTTNLVAASGNVLRTYRLALAATGEYTNVFRQAGDTDAQAKQRAFQAMTTTMNRVNGLYERDLAMRMVFFDAPPAPAGLTATQLDIIYTNPATDPYTNSDGVLMLDENQANLDAVVKDPNYDIGHVFSTGGGGVAQLRCPCKSGQKAQGVTGLPNPTGDVFAIDYVAHEMGHQFGGNHTFNGTAVSCGTPGQRNNAASMEPGSGSTIQAYAGICTTQDLQPNSDDYFHVKSLEEIIAYTTGTGAGHEGNTCDDETDTNNAAPVVEAGPNYTIPRDTPFALTASATDPDGDAVTYDWEEYDAGGLVGPSGPPNGTGAGEDDDDDNVARPVFRSYKPTTSPTRLFPSLKYILNNDNQPPTTYTCGERIRVQGNDVPIPCLTGEAMPSINRTMTFQVTARDNRSAGGGVRSDSMQVTVVRNSGVTLFGPFRVAQPNTAVSWPGRSTQTVTWDVANTNLAPISAANVRISVSVDGGQTFPLVLKESTPNDGSEAITVPNIDTTTARLKVEAVGNIFFDISNADFQIVADPCLTNHALTANGATVSASSTSTDRNYAATGAIDGDRKGTNWEAGGGWNDATRDLWPDWLEVTFNGPKAINQIRVYGLQDNFGSPVEPTPAMTSSYYGLLDFEVQTWDGSGWVTVPGGSVTGNNLVMRTFVFPEVTTTKIRVHVTNARGHYSRIVEVEAIGCGGQ